MVGHMSRLTSAFSPMIILTTELMHAGLRLVSKITFVDNILRLMIDEDWRGRKPPLGQRNSCMYACIKEKLEPMFGQWLCRPTQAVVVVVFLHDKVFCQFLLRTPRFILLSLSLSWISLSVYISINLQHNLASRPGGNRDSSAAGPEDGTRTDHTTRAQG